MSATDLSTNSQRSKQVAALATVVLLASTYFGIIIIALHFLRPDYNPISEPTSRYAVGPYGFLMTSAFLSMSLATWALVIGLYRGLSKPARSRIGLGLLGIWGIGLLIAMMFPIDLEGAPQTTSGTIHRINGPLVFLSLTAGTILVSRPFKQDARWRPFQRSALILSLIMLTATIATLLNVVTGLGFAGLCQRIVLAVFVAWLLLTAARLRSIAMGSVPA